MTLKEIETACSVLCMALIYWPFTEMDYTAGISPYMIHITKTQCC